MSKIICPIFFYLLNENEMSEFFGLLIVDYKWIWLLPDCTQGLLEGHFQSRGLHFDCLHGDILEVEVTMFRWNGLAAAVQCNVW